MGKIFCILGQTSSGKSTIEKKLLEYFSYDNKVQSLISTTTRPMRDYEKQYDPYYFITELDFLNAKKDGQFAETASYRVSNGDTWYYGTLKKDIDLKHNNYIKVVNPCGYRKLVNLYGEDVIGIYIRCKGKIRLLRSLHRESDPNCSEICRRFLSDKEDFKGIANEVNYIVANEGELQTVVEEVAHFIETFIL